MVLNAPCSWLIPTMVLMACVKGGWGMVFRTAGAIAALLIGLGGGQALAQYYPAPPQAYPPQAYPPGYRPLPPLAEADDPLPLHDPSIVESRPLPPMPVGPQANDPPPPGYGRGAPGYPEEAALPPPSAPAPYAEPPPGVQGYEPASAATRPYTPGGLQPIQPGAPGPSEQDAARPRPVPRPGRSGRCGRDRIGARGPAHGGAAAGLSAGDRTGKATAAAVPPDARRVPRQGAGWHDRHRYPEHLSLSRAGRRPGPALRRGRRPRGLHLGRRRTGDEDGGVAGLASAGRDDRAPALSAALHGRRSRQSARRARALSRQDDLPHPRHQSALDHRHVRVVGLHPADQRGRDGPLQPRQGRQPRGGAAGQAPGHRFGGADGGSHGRATRGPAGVDGPARPAALGDGAVAIPTLCHSNTRTGLPSRKARMSSTTPPK